MFSFVYEVAHGTGLEILVCAVALHSGNTKQGNLERIRMFEKTLDQFFRQAIYILNCVNV